MLHPFHLSKQYPSQGASSDQGKTNVSYQSVVAHAKGGQLIVSANVHRVQCERLG